MDDRKRKTNELEEAIQNPVKRIRKGFSVGPANLPDGTYRRKVQKIKRSLIDSAKIRKQYSKIREQDLYSKTRQIEIYPDQDQTHDIEEIHPDRKQMLQEAETPQHMAKDQMGEAPYRRTRASHQQSTKRSPFMKEVQLAERRKVEATARKQARDTAHEERQKKMEDRDRFRKAMAKARSGGSNGQRKLGRESKILLERVQRLVGDG